MTTPITIPLWAVIVLGLSLLSIGLGLGLKLGAWLIGRANDQDMRQQGVYRSPPES